MELHGKNLIGSTIAAAGEGGRRAFDPTANKEIDPVFCSATPEEVDHAMGVAGEAFTAFRALPREKRAAFLERIGEEIMALDDALIQRCTAETALPETRLTSERGRTVNQLSMFAELVREGSWVEARIDRAQPDREPAPKPDLRLMLQPLGPVIVFGPSNFPLAFGVAGGDTASALAAGCPVVVKAHHGHPGTSELVGRAIQKAATDTGMPEGVFSLLHGRGREVGLALVRHPAARAVGFTGSHTAGRALADAAAARPQPIPVYAEMGSINPVFLLPGALEERSAGIAAGLQQSATLGVGQFCTNPGLVFGVRGPAMDRFLEELATRFSEAKAATMLTPGICAAYNEGVEHLQSIEGVRVIGRTASKAEKDRSEGAPHVFAADLATLRASPSLRHEVFGPSTLVITCPSAAEMLDVAGDLDGQLTATIHGTEEEIAESAELVTTLARKVGRVVFNGFPTGVEVCPSMHHGGPYPATTDGRSTSVGTAAIFRFCRLVCYQNAPQAVLPPELQDGNPAGIWRLMDGQYTRDAAL